MVTTDGKLFVSTLYAITLVDKVYIACYFKTMNLQTLSATKARNNFFDILDQVLQGKSFVVERNEKPVAMISHVESGTDIKKLKKVLKFTKGIFSDDDYIDDDNILRNKKANKFLGSW